MSNQNNYGSVSSQQNSTSNQNYSFSPSTSSGQTYAFPVTGINSNSGTISISGGIIPGAITSTTISEPTKKSKIKFVVVKKDGTYRVLSEQNPITPRQLLAITKFIFCAQSSNATAKFNWDSLISELGIADHFCDCKTLDNSSDTHYFKLY